MPHDDATPYARFEIESISKARGQKAKIQFIESSRAFNDMAYDEAYRTIGLDNVCAIYRKELLVKTPFPKVDFAEDIAWGLKNMLLGHKVLYQPDIKVKHSHNRSPEYAFNRQIINSYWCAKIMNRVRDDISLLTVGDLMALASEMGRFVNRLRSDNLDGRKSGDINGSRASQVIDGIQKRYSLRNRAKCFLADKFSKHSKNENPERRRIQQQAEEGVKHMLNAIRKTYNLTSEEELMEVFEQSAANILGRIYGETYASCMLRGKMSSQLDAFIRPYMKGV